MDSALLGIGEGILVCGYVHVWHLPLYLLTTGTGQEALMSVYTASKEPISQLSALGVLATHSPLLWCACGLKQLCDPADAISWCAGQAPPHPCPVQANRAAPW